MMPRAPSISCRSVTRSRNLPSEARSSRLLPSTTTSTSNSLEGKRRVTSSYCLNSGVSERKSWLKESSTLIRVTPKAAAIDKASVISAIRMGKRSETSPICSIPSASLNGAFGDGVSPEDAPSPSDVCADT